MADVEELVVRARPQGVQETTDQLEGMEEQFEETSGGMEEQTNLFQEMANRIDGLMGAVVAGLAVATAGILANVPILQQALGGVVSLFEAFGFQLDQLLRQLGAGGLVDFLFNFSSAIFELDGAVGDLVGFLSGAIPAAVAGYIAALKAGIVSSGALTGALSTIGSVISSVVLGALGALASILGLPVAAVAALVAAVVGLIAVFVTDFMGIRTATVNVISDVLRIMGSLASRLASTTTDIAGVFLTLASDIVDAVVGIGGDIASAFLGVVDDGLTWGQSLVRNIAQGIRNGIDWAVDAIQNLVQRIKEALANLPGVDTVTDAAGIGLNITRDVVNRVEGSLSNIVDGGTTGAGTVVPQGTGGDVYLDGQLINENQRRYGQSTITRNGGR
jgi:phage-related protein